ncbi:XRE family transcriptional regulator [uncultured Roseibium sp.]|uniref:helix-turn-helix domain-containing protein n=1 Tax=uncultured Roseibium sp. TaxID=1936171 RepID=UPI0032176BC8
MNRLEIAQRLRAARELASISQNEAADALDLPRTAVTQIEGGNRAVSTMELVSLAELYRRPVSWFFAEAPDAEEDVVIALHRIAPGLDDAPNIRSEVDRCVRICREGVSLEGLLGREERDGPPAYREPVPRSTGEAVMQGERIAEQERKRLELGSAPVADMTELLGDQGIWASVAELPPTMSGLFLHHRSIGMAVLVNARHVRARQRFSLAHEYAHALLDRDRVVGVSSATNSSERIEQRANAFAAAFLLPEAGLEEELRQLGKGQPARTDQIVFDVATGGSIQGQLRPAPRSQTIGFQDVAFIAYRFGVSYQAAVYRLKSLRYVNQPESALLLSSEHEAAGGDYLRALDLFDDLETPVSAGKGTRELRSRVAHLGLEAYRLGEISRGRLLDVGKTIGVDGRKLLDLAEAARAE